MRGFLGTYTEGGGRTASAKAMRRCLADGDSGMGRTRMGTGTAFGSLDAITGEAE